MPTWLIVVIGLLLLLVLAVLFLELAGKRWVVTRGLDPDRLELFVRRLLEVMTDQSQLVVRREEGEGRLRLVKHVETESVTDLYLSLAEKEWPSLDSATERLSRHGVRWQRKSGFADGERLQVHGIEDAPRAVELMLLLFGLEGDSPEARFTVHFEGYTDSRLMREHLRKIRAGEF